MKSNNILKQNRDYDTLGGRISRAREAVNMSIEDASENVGVTQETYDNWESDRDEPRSNRLIILAGVLSVSPSWLLYGVGEAPASENISEEITNLKWQLFRLKESYEATGSAIEMMGQAIKRLEGREN